LTAAPGVVVLSSLLAAAASAAGGGGGGRVLGLACGLADAGGTAGGWWFFRLPDVDGLALGVNDGVEFRLDDETELVKPFDFVPILLEDELTTEDDMAAEPPKLLGVLWGPDVFCGVGGSIERGIPPPPPILLESSDRPVLTPCDVFLRVGMPSANSPPIPGSLGVGPGGDVTPPPPPPPPPFIRLGSVVGGRFLLAPPTCGALRSLVTAFFSFVPARIDCSKAPVSGAAPPPPPPSFIAGGGGAEGGGGGPGGGGGGGGGGIAAGFFLLT